MDTLKIFDSEYRFCLILLEHEPVNSTKLVELYKGELVPSPSPSDTVCLADVTHDGVPEMSCRGHRTWDCSYLRKSPE